LAFNHNHFFFLHVVVTHGYSSPQVSVSDLEKMD
jgi:hypothetical protein